MPISKAISRWLFAIRKAKGPLRSRSEASKRRNALIGFTLIELLVAIVILGILAGIVARTNNISQQKARDAIRKKHLSEIAVALRAAYADRWGDPPSVIKAKNNFSGEPGTQCTGIGTSAPNFWAWGSAWTIGTTTYMERLPTDPKPVSASWNYCYDVNTTGNQNFRLMTNLEFAQDPDRNTACDDSHAGSNYDYCIDENGKVTTATLPWP